MGGMKQGGFTLSELKMSGFSTADLRLAGFSTAALQAMQQSLWRQVGGAKLQRRNTFHIRHDFEEKKAKGDEEDAEIGQTQLANHRKSQYSIVYFQSASFVHQREQMYLAMACDMGVHGL